MSTNSFIDADTHMTVAAGTIRGEVQAMEGTLAHPLLPTAPVVSPDVVWQEWNVSRAERERRNGHRAVVLWFTGLSGAGKSTLACALERELFEAGCQTMLIDGDQVRHGLCGDLDFSPGDRAENIRRAGEVARLFFEQGSIVLCTFVSPALQDRERVRGLIGADDFVEIYVRCELAVCRQRDPKGLYARAAAGSIRNLTGVSAPYEEPQHPDLVLDTTSTGPTELVQRLMAHLLARRILTDGGPVMRRPTTSDVWRTRPGR